MAKVIGLGGVFLKFKDPEAIRKWYNEVLGITTNDHGILFEFGNSTKKGYIQYGTFGDDTSYFGSPEQQCMINFRVDNLEELVSQLKERSVKIVSEQENYDYGKFIHIEDPEGNRIELWEPVDKEFEGDDESKMPLL